MKIGFDIFKLIPLYNPHISGGFYCDMGIALNMNRFMDILDPLENKSLPIIRVVEKMLLGSHLWNIIRLLL